MTNHIYYTAAVVAKQKRRADLDIEQKRIKRNILRKNTGKHLLMSQLLRQCQILRIAEQAKKDLTTAQELLSS